MRVGVLGAVPFNLIFGGGETQLLNTMDALRKLGVDVTFWDQFDRRYECDILHIFGCHYWLFHVASLARAKGIRIALSTISYVPGNHWSTHLWSYLDPWLPVDTTFRLNRKLVACADALLPNSNAEVSYLTSVLRAREERIYVIPNGANLRFLTGDGDTVRKTYGLGEFVLCVGKIEPRKNQLKLVQTFAGWDKQLVLIGDAIPNRLDYFAEVLRVVKGNENIMHIPAVPHASGLLASAYAAATVHVLLARNETPGIVNLEAGLAGGNLVVAECPPVREYLGSYAEYCDPASIPDIRRAIDVAFSKPRSNELRAFITDNYTWEIAARKTLAVYEDIMSGKRL
jgi:glycosyltransferase involved in cell wall biosynthesis